VIAVGGIRQRAGLVDDANARLLRLNDDALDVFTAGRSVIAASTAVCA
jgi:hypothetical protein